MCMKDDMKSLIDRMDMLESSFDNMYGQFLELKKIMITKNVDFFMTFKDLTDSMNYIKSYIGCDEFFKECTKNGIDGNNCGRIE